MMFFFIAHGLRLNSSLSNRCIFFHTQTRDTLELRWSPDTSTMTDDIRKQRLYTVLSASNGSTPSWPSKSKQKSTGSYGYAYPTSTLRKVVPLSCLLVLTIRSQHYFFENLNITSSLVLKAPRPTAYYNITSSLVLKAPRPTAYYNVIQRMTTYYNVLQRTSRYTCNPRQAHVFPTCANHCLV